MAGELRHTGHAGEADNNSITCAGIATAFTFHEYPVEEVKKIVSINVMFS